MTIKDIGLNDDLKRLGILEFKKQGQSTILVLCKTDKNNKAVAVLFPISKDGLYDTLMNFENAAKGKLDKTTIEATKVALLQDSDYMEVLLYGNGHTNGNTKSTSDESGVVEGGGGGGGQTSDNCDSGDILQPSSLDDEIQRKKSSSAQRSLELIEQQCSELFLDQFGSPYAAIKVGEHTETLALKSSRFKNWLCKACYEAEGGILNNENVNSVLNILKAKAEFGGIIKDLRLRVADRDEKEELFTIHYDLTNKDWQTIKISAENGWTIEYAPTIFRRYSNQQPQVYPSKEYPPDIFDRFMRLINVKDGDNKLLLKCYIISLFYPEIPKPILMLHGEQGSAKSTSQELIKMLVDPSSIKTVTFPRDITVLVQGLMHNYICYFDNVSVIPEWISDQLCRAVTGSGFSKRELWTDDDDIIYNFRRCLGVNGINLAATKADLLDRSVIVEHERIPKEKTQKIEVIWEEFNKIKAQLLGYIFDILVKVLQVKKNGGIKIVGYPRMADFAELCEIVSRCMGNKENEFLNAYYKNIDLQVEEAIEAHPVATAIVEFIESRQNNEWKGTATELLTELEQIATQLKIDTRQKLWPKAANILSRRIPQVRTILREIGIIIEKESSDNSNKILSIRKVCKDEENRILSTESPESTVRENQTQNQLESSGDTNAPAGDISPDTNKVSYEKEAPQNQAQNNPSVDNIDTVDIIPTSSKHSSDNNMTITANEDKIQKQNINIYRIDHTDNFGCKNCKMIGDRFFMQVHACSGAT